MSEIRAPKGTYDLLPVAAARRDDIVVTAAAVFAAYGYRHIVTPEFEETGLFERGVGTATDVVRKEMYTFADRSDRSLTLRPEGTAPICRAYLEHGMHKLPQPVKLWYYAPMFRYERPQAGRYREHYQLGAEAIGSADPFVDAEVIGLLGQLLGELGVGGLRLLVNSMGDGVCRPAYVARLREYLTAHKAQLCAECRERIELNPLRTFDCKQETCQAVLATAPHMIDHLCADCRAHFDTMLGLLARVGFEAEIDFRLVRGLDYYTRTTFEFQSAALDFAQSAVGGGGRYDGLVEQIGGPATPGVGFGAGLERITLAMEAEVETREAIDAYLVCADEAARTDAFALAQRLRRELMLEVEMDLAGRTTRGQFKQAARTRADVTVVLGLPDVPPGSARVRLPAGLPDEEVELGGMVDWFKKFRRRRR